MHMPVEKGHMQQPVYPIEIKALPDRDEKEQRDEPDGVGGPCQHRRIAIGHRPEHQDLVGGPEKHSAAQRPEHVVPDLAAERELPAVLHQRAGVVFQFLPLPCEGVEIEIDDLAHLRNIIERIKKVQGIQKVRCEEDEY